MFWTGPPLSPYEQLALQSFIAAGARVFVYSTTKTLRVPEGVELVDVRELLPGPVHRFIFPDGDASPALHSDLFRYAGRVMFKGLERKGGMGVWELVDEHGVGRLFARHHASEWLRAR